MPSYLHRTSLRNTPDDRLAVLGREDAGGSAVHASVLESPATLDPFRRQLKVEEARRVDVDRVHHGALACVRIARTGVHHGSPGRREALEPWRRWRGGIREGRTNRWDRICAWRRVGLRRIAHPCNARRREHQRDGPDVATHHAAHCTMSHPNARATSGRTSTPTNHFPSTLALE